MRRSLAALLLTVQLQPFWGLVVCLAFTPPTTGNGEHCEQAAVVTPTEGASQVQAPQDAPSPHHCPLGDACVPSVVALVVLPAPPIPVAAPPTLSPSSADAAIGLARFAPPTPPPNL